MIRRDIPGVTCAYAACHRPGRHRADGWDFCGQHHSQHMAEFHPRPGMAPQARKPTVDEETSRAWQLLRDRFDDCELHDILSRSVRREVAANRHYAMWVVRRYTSLSLPAIGKMFDRDHSTVLWGIRTAERRLQVEVAA